MSDSRGPLLEYVPNTSIHSQHDEEAIIAALLDWWPEEQLTKKVVDIGARLRFSNVARLIETRGYTGNLIDMKPDAAAELQRRFGHIDGIQVFQEKVVLSNVHDFLLPDYDVLSIDIDSNDWWIWAAIPPVAKIVCVEFNNHKDGLYVETYDENMPKGGGKINGKKQMNYGASERAFLMLGDLLGYGRIAQTGSNLIFVKL